MRAPGGAPKGNRVHDDLYRLVYLSNNDIVGEDAAVKREIEHILSTARRNNERVGVTGALMFNAGCFAQVLEGAHDAIQGVFERIQCDPRHSRVVVLSFEPAEVRGFADWSMAYVGTDRDALAEFSHIARESGHDGDALAGERLLDLLREHLLEAEGVQRARRV